MPCSHSSIFCIIPPHMVENIIENGTTRQKDHAVRNLHMSGQFRGKRQSVAEIARKPQTVTGQKQRKIYDAQNGIELPGKLARQEGEDPTGDPAVDEAYDGSGATYDLFFDIYERNSIDGYGMQLTSIVHYSQGYDNAFWDGEKMVYGDGDEDLPESERLFNRFTASLDVIGHELTHGVTQFEANLVYQDQPGALNESFSDVFGILVKQRLLNQDVSGSDWLIGSELFTNNVNGEGIRSMKRPGTAYDDPVLGKDPQPAHMRDYVDTTRDNGGVHINSGIPNRAFFEAATEIGGNAWEKAGKIWYIALRDKLSESTTFHQAADLISETAGELYGTDSPEQQAVKSGWEKVGITSNLEANSGCLPGFSTLLTRNRNA